METKTFDLESIKQHLSSTELRKEYTPWGEETCSTAQSLKETIIEDMEDPEDQSFYYGDYVDSKSAYQAIMECLEANAQKRDPNAKFVRYYLHQVEKSILAEGLTAFISDLDRFDPTVNNYDSSNDNYGENYTAYYTRDEQGKIIEDKYETLGDRVREACNKCNCTIHDICITGDDTGDYIAMALLFGDDLVELFEQLEGAGSDLFIKLVKESPIFTFASKCYERVVEL